MSFGRRNVEIVTMNLMVELGGAVTALLMVAFLVASFAVAHERDD